SPPPPAPRARRGPCTARRTAARGRRAPAWTAPGRYTPSRVPPRSRLKPGGAARCGRDADSRRRRRERPSFRRDAERQQVLVAQEIVAALEFKARRLRVRNHFRRFHPFVHRRPWTAAILLEIDD